MTTTPLKPDLDSLRITAEKRKSNNSRKRWIWIIIAALIISLVAVAASAYLNRGLRRARHWFDSAGVPGPRARVPRNVPPSYPSFLFGLLSPIENASLPKQGLARAEIDPAGANGESRGAAPGRRAASPLRTTGRLRTWALLYI